MPWISNLDFGRSKQPRGMCTRLLSLPKLPCMLMSNNAFWVEKCHMHIFLHHERDFKNEFQKFVKVFMDNVNIYSHGWEEHYTIWSKFFLN
jgi:hypothetical protein